MPKPQTVPQNMRQVFYRTTDGGMSFVVVSAKSDEEALEIFERYRENKSDAPYFYGSAVEAHRLDLIVDGEISDEPKGINRLQFIQNVEERAREYAKDAAKSLVRNNHMNDIEEGEVVQQRIIDAVLVDFINYVAGIMCVDYGMYVKDLSKK